MIVHVITGLSHGGAQNALFRLVTTQTSSNYVVSLTDEGVFGGRLRRAGVHVTCLGMHGWWSSLKAFLTLVRLLRRLRPSVVQTWMYHADLLGGIAARVAGVPVCWGIRNGDLSPARTSLTTRLVVRLCAFASRRVPTTIVSCGARAVQVHRALGYAERFVVIPNGLDFDRFRPCPEQGLRVKASLGIPQAARVIGHVGRQDPQKDHSALFRAFSRVAARDSNVRFVVVGSGMERDSPYLKSLLEGDIAEGQIVALGARDDVEELMPAMDVFALSSSGEAFPNVVLEAMACGVPCVVTDVGDAAEIVGDTGWIVAPGEPAALAAALCEALRESPAAHAARGERARQRVKERYGIDRMIQGYRAVWDKASEGSAQPCAA